MHCRPAAHAVHIEQFEDQVLLPIEHSGCAYCSAPARVLISRDSTKSDLRLTELTGLGSGHVAPAPDPSYAVCLVATVTNSDSSLLGTFLGHRRIAGTCAGLPL